jgi:hypothetical protein
MATPDTITVSRAEFERMQARVNRVLGAQEALTDWHLIKAKREIGAMRRADSAAEQEARDDAARRADHCSNARFKYSDAFQSHNLECPRPEPDDYPGEYKCRMLDQLLRRMPDTYRYRDMRRDDLEQLARQPAAFRQIESDILADALAEGIRPSGSRRPDSAWAPEATRVRRDEKTGAVQVVNVAKRSFIHGLSRRGKRVVALGPRRQGDLVYPSILFAQGD